jgi:hypothetical protein
MAKMIQGGKGDLLQNKPQEMIKKSQEKKRIGYT